MVNKGIKINKKAAVSFTVIFLSLILGFVVINAAYNFMSIGVNKYNQTLPAAQNQTFSALNESQSALDDNIQEIRASVGNITVQTGLLQTFWNSFVGLGAILKLPISLIDVGISSASALILGTEIVPAWFQVLAIMLIVIIIILSVVAAMTGGNSNI